MPIDLQVMYKCSSSVWRDSIQSSVGSLFNGTQSMVGRVGGVTSGVDGFSWVTLSIWRSLASDVHIMDVTITQHAVMRMLNCWETVGWNSTKEERNATEHNAATRKKSALETWSFSKYSILGSIQNWPCCPNVRNYQHQLTTPELWTSAIELRNEQRC